jgi:hypothetical protein
MFFLNPIWDPYRLENPDTMKNNLHHYFLYLFLFLPVFSIKGQVDSLPPETLLENQDYIEDFIQFLESSRDVDFDFNTLYEQLEYFSRRPLDLNKATEEELAVLGLMPQQILEFLRYRREAGDLIAIYELQVIPGFDQKTINRILPFIKVGGDVDDFQAGLLEMATSGTNELYLRWNRFMETQDGFLEREDGRSSPFEGDPNRFYMRYRHNHSFRLSYGFTAEKDIGEAFFTGSNPNGFDFYSAFFYLKDYKKWLRSLALGDFTISLGQGLILHSGFGGSKSAQVTNIKKMGRTIRPYSSVNETAFMRGGAATIGLGEKWELSLFGSVRRRDANLTDTLFLDNSAIAQFSSLQQTGFHRTEAEIADEGALRQFTTGGALKYKADRWEIGANLLYDQFDKRLQRTPQPFNRFYFNGDKLLNVSLDYTFLFRNLHFFGETARSDNGAIATLNGLFIGLDRSLDLALLVRHLPRDYQALNANVFAETAQGNNETGVYLGLEFSPSRQWNWSAYFDLYEHPWLRFQIDAPSRGHEFRSRLTYSIRRKLDVYLKVRTETKERNRPNNETKVDYLAKERLTQGRLHISNKLNKSLELRNRIHYGLFENAEGRQNGFQFHQDVIYNPIGIPLSLTARFAIFDTDSFAVRFYSFENNLLYSFSIPAYYDQGTRFYINLRYKGIRNLTLEGRFAQTYFSQRDEVGSGFDAVEGQVRTEVAAQMKVKF